MGYFVGSDGEQLVVSEDGLITYEPSGLLHAVDEASLAPDQQAQLGYALCGAAVRIWSAPIDEAASPLHDTCLALVERAEQPG